MRFAGSPGLLLLGLMAAVGIAVSQLGIPVVLGEIVDKALLARDAEALTRLASILVALALGTVLFQGLHDGVFGYAGERSLRDLQSRLLRTLLGRPLDRVQGQRAGEIQALLTVSLPAVARFNDQVIGETVRQGVQLAGLLGILVWRYGVAGLAVLAVVPLYLVLPWQLARRTRVAQRQHLDATAAVHTRLQEAVLGARELQSYGQEGWPLRQLAGPFARRFASRMRVVALGAAGWINYALSFVVGAAVYWLGGQWVLAGGMSVGELVTLVAIVGYLEGPLGGLTRLYLQAQAVRAAAEQVAPHLDSIQGDPETLRRPPMGPASTPPPEGPTSVEAVDLGFRFPTAERDALEGVTFRAGAGSTVAIVGPSGAGKSTLLSLILRLYRPTAGELRWGGGDVDDLDSTTFRRSLGVVPQDPLLVPATVAENLRFGRSGIPHRALVGAVDLAHAGELVAQLPQGFDTPLGDGGVGLSGGQRQRLAIARALAGDPSLLVLDEATSALDAGSAARVRSALRDARRGRTTFLVTHDPSLAEDADLVLHLDAGRLLEQGNHAQLLRSSARYRRLWAGGGAAAPMPSETTRDTDDEPDEETPMPTPLRICDHVHFDHLEEDIVLLDERQGKYYSLDPLASRIWQTMADSGRPQDAAEGIAADHGVERSRVDRDVDALVNRWLDLGLVQPRAEGHRA
ncbi:MAG: PqqD family peptide modification chaperone [Acidobacteriota bacterium]